jgi:putative PIN family toxin of toxin-antitoxin system
MLRIVVDTNLWIRVLLGGRHTLPLLAAWRLGRFEVLVSEPLLAELDKVSRRPRLRRHINAQDALDLLEQLRERGAMVVTSTTPPGCRDPKDQPVPATAIDGHADAIVTGDADLRADDALRRAMARRGVRLWGVDALLAHVADSE